MKLYLDTDTWLLSTAAGGSNTTVTIPAKQGGELRLEIFPSSPLAAGTLGTLIAKPKDEYAAPSVSWDLEWESPTTSESGYLFRLPLGTAALADLFPPGVKSVQLMAEITIVSGASVFKTQTIAMAVARQVSSSEEGTPVSLPDLKASQQEAEAGTNNSKWMTPLRTLQAILARLGNVDNTADSVKPVSTPQAAALAGKANTSHQHVIADVGGLQTALDNKVTSSGQTQSLNFASSGTDSFSVSANSTTFGLTAQNVDNGTINLLTVDGPGGAPKITTLVPTYLPSNTYINGVKLQSIATSGSYNDLTNKPTIPAAQVNSDWNAVSGVAQILNKPNLNTGKTIYVDSGVGTDTRTGLSQYSLNAPFATIAAAATASALGDLIYVRAGNYAIASTISLNGKGNLYFEQGANVIVSANVVAFSVTANEPKVIGGFGIFTLSGTGGLWTQSGGNNTLQQVAIEFAAITNASGAGTIFSVTTGILVINSRGLVTAPASTVVSEIGVSGNVFYQVLFTYCARLLDMPQANSTMQFTALCWTVQIFGTEGISIVSGTTSLRIENLVGGGLPFTKLVVFKFVNGDATFNSHVFRGGRLIANNSQPCITFNSTTATNKIVKLMGDTQLITSAANCIVSADTREVFVSSAHSNVAADTNTNIRPSGKLSVDPYFVY